MDMKNYNPFSWLLWIKQIPKQSIFIKLKFFLLYMIIYSAIIGFIDYKYSFFNSSNNLGQFHLLFSFCLSIIIAFRINVAYARWWEGRGQLGSLMNNMRNLAIKFNNFIGLKNDLEFKQCLIAFPNLLKSYLRNQTANCEYIITELNLKHNQNDNLPSVLINTLSKKINHYRISGKISFEQFIVLDSHIVALADILGGCEKISNTPVPISFSVFTRFALLFYMLIFPFGWVNSFGYLIIPIIIVIIYVLLGIEVLAEEMEDPFGEEVNDLPLDNITSAIEKQIKQIADFG